MFNSVQEVWAQSPAPTTCNTTIVENGPYSTTEYAAVAAAYTDDPISSADILWSVCADVDGPYQTNGPLNDVQRAEIAGALMLCPDHPSAAIMANGSAEQQERAAGVRFGDGVREIGAQIQPGTYRASGDIKNCYWARLDAAGGTIENNFVPSATQVEVTVEPSDFSFHVEGCGEFVKIG
ncbi:hypothetical protein ACTU6V_12700 [Microbacterium sp. A204]|uniref:hypothetical protein n=1 Tax=Microbacterium sp. A204 TaxID=3457321 RepID=UPI003FCFBC6F